MMNSYSLTDWSLSHLIDPARYIYNAHWKAEIAWGLFGKEGGFIATGAMLFASSDSASFPGRTPTMTRRFLRPGNLANMANLPWSIVHSAGWHFSSFGGAQVRKS